MQELVVAKKAALQAGEVITKLFGKVKDIRKKARADYVTEADYGAEEVIIKTIKKAFPNDRILSEELHPDTTQFDKTWIVDGLDGTNNYVSGVPIFGTNIACYRENKCVAAVVFIPTFQELYYASDSEDGAFLNKKRIHVSKESVLEYSAGAITTSALRDKSTRTRLEQIFQDAGRLRCTGAACYDSALVAKGVFDFRISIPEKAVDIAAPYYIVQKAGGQATNVDGSPLTLDSGAWIASNGKLQERIISLLNDK